MQKTFPLRNQHINVHKMRSLDGCEYWTSTKLWLYKYECNGGSLAWKSVVGERVIRFIIVCRMCALYLARAANSRIHRQGLRNLITAFYQCLFNDSGINIKSVWYDGVIIIEPRHTAHKDSFSVAHWLLCCLNITTENIINSCSESST